MAFHKIGNQILTDAEYEADKKTNWIFILAVTGAMIGAGALGSYVDRAMMSKGLMLLAVSVGAIAGGMILVRLAAIIKFAAIVLALYVIGDSLLKTPSPTGSKTTHKVVKSSR